MNNAIEHLEQLNVLLEIEYNCEKEAFRRQTEAVGMERKVKRGDAWWPVAVTACRYNALNQPVVEIERRDADADVEHNFEYGRPVCFFTMEEGARGSRRKISYLPFTATVSYAGANSMVVALPDSGRMTALAATRGLGVQLSFDETSYRLMFQALKRTISARDCRLAYLRDLFASAAPAQRFSFDDPSLPWLNPSQQHAVGEVMRAKDVAIVHGPPGTGKTTTLVEAVYATLQREPQVLVCAQSNTAVDWISEKLTDRGVPVLRLGNPTRVNDKMLAFCYERQFEAHPDYPQLWSLRKAMRELRQHRRATDGWHQKMDRLKCRATELELAINQQLFAQARVIACTLTGAASRLLDGTTFGTLFIDEAAQALEPACWIAIARAHRVVLAGDHCQLPPTVKSIAALKAGLGRTLMERIVQRKPEVVTLLTVQYRMSEPIMRFSSDYFYEGKVQTAPEIRFRGILDLDTPITWVDTAEVEGHEEFVGESFGRINRAEAALTLDVLQRYYEKIGRSRAIDEHIDVGVISPYRAQVQLLRSLVGKSDFMKPLRRLVTMGTVDGFQGQERDIIVISLVRSNDGGDIGFLRDLRRMNVAMTRARMKLIILGDADTMTRHPFYKKLYEYIRKQSPSPAACGGSTPPRRRGE